MAKRDMKILDTDDVLRKHSKPVTEITDRILQLLDDMQETMVEYDGVGLAAPQVGVLRRVFIVDVGEGLYEFINPEIIETSGNVLGQEGCLSVPNTRGSVYRPDYLKVKYTDRFGEEKTIEATDFFARAICHESDHLDGIVYIDKAQDIEKF